MASISVLCRQYISRPCQRIYSESWPETPPESPMYGRDQDTLQIPVNSCLDFDGKREDSNCVTKVCVYLLVSLSTRIYWLMM